MKLRALAAGTPALMALASPPAAVESPSTLIDRRLEQGGHRASHQSHTPRDPRSLGCRCHDERRSRRGGQFDHGRPLDGSREPELSVRDQGDVRAERLASAEARAVEQLVEPLAFAFAADQHQVTVFPVTTVNKEALGMLVREIPGAIAHGRVLRSSRFMDG